MDVGFNLPSFCCGLIETASLLLIWMLLLLLVDTQHQQKVCGQRWQQLKQIAKVDTNVLKQETYIEELLLYALFSVSQKVVLKDLKTKISSFKKPDMRNIIPRFNDLNLFYK